MRNPWRMVESMYRHFHDERQRLSDTPRPRQGVHRQSAHDYLLRFSRQTFEEFVCDHYSYLTACDGFWDYFCQGTTGSCSVRPFFFETLDRQWQEILPLLKLPAGTSRPQCNAALKLHAVEWTPSAVRFIKRYCRDDFDRFGYPDTPDA